jgi:two-component system NtrC family sensor kinase
LAATGRLAATLAHEINNPLQTIYNCLQLMLNFQLEPDEQRNYLTTMSEEIQRLTGIVTRTLDFARRSQPEMRPAPLNAVVEKVLALTGKYLQHRHIVLRRELAPDLPPILANPDELAQVLLNLVLNAADAMPEGGTLYVTSEMAENGWVAASFMDTGCGIPPENLGRIFEPFFSTKEGGTGLGLDVSRQITERHGGRISVESEVGKGSTFTVWLPMANRKA